MVMQLLDIECLVGSCAIQVGIFDYIDDSTQTLSRNTQLNDEEISLNNNNIYNQASKQLAQAQASSSQAVILSTTPSGNVTNSQTQQNGNLGEEDDESEVRQRETICRRILKCCIEIEMRVSRNGMWNGRCTTYQIITTRMLHFLESYLGPESCSRIIPVTPVTISPESIPGCALF